MNIEKELWGKSPCGKDIYRYTLKNSSGAYVQLSSVGAGIVAAVVPDRDGKLADVVLGYSSPLSYFDDGPCAGKIPGRYANRIAKGRFTLDGKEYTLPVNNGPNHLHGGPKGFQNQVWDSRIHEDGVEFMYYSEDGEMGYPGALKAVARYEWSEENELRLTLTAETDAPTVVNLTNHAYFNLAGESAGNCLDHRIQLKADRRTEIGADMAPTGNCPTVAGTPYDLNSGKSFREILEALPNGFDDNFILSDVDGVMKRDVVVASADSTGIELRVATSAPGIQFYMGYFLNGSAIGKNGKGYPQFSAFCLEAQRWPDAVNHPDFPSMRLEPGRPCKQTTVYQFGIAK